MENTFKNLRMDIFCGIYALFYTFCLYKNYSGVTFPFFAAGTLCFFLYYMKKQGRTMKRFSAFLMAVIMALSINICMTDSPYLAFFDRLFIFVLFFTLFLTNLYDDETWDVSRYTSAIALTVCSLVKYLPRPFRDAIDRAKSRRAAKTALTTDDIGQPDPLMSAGISEENEPSPFRRNIKYVVLGLVIALPILLVVLPLLASSDAVFRTCWRGRLRLILTLTVLRISLGSA